MPSTAKRALRHLHPSWIAAGRRRILARNLRERGYTFGQIAAVTGVSAEQARRDTLPSRAR